jgi:signal transduction histidine kinase
VLLRRRDGGDVGAYVNAARRERAGRAVTDCAVLEVRERVKYEEALLRAKQAAEAARASLEARTRELEDANERLAQQAVELELQQQQLQEQAAELEDQSDELHAVNDRLHAVNDALHAANDQLLARGGELEAARAAADAASAAKSQFLATMSHELRTPLNAIGGYVQLLQLGIHGPLAPAQAHALDRVARAQRHLLGLINDVLNLARIEAGRVEYAREEVRVADVVAGVMPMVEPQLAAAGLTSATSVAPDLVARADPEKVEQILINLLTNAVKFTPPGGVVRVEAGRGGEAGCVVVGVSDTGIGIAPDKLDSVFEPFVQVRGADRARGGAQGAQGTGLGLAISRDLARGMGGDLRARSEERRGSTFTLELPGA